MKWFGGGSAKKPARRRGGTEQVSVDDLIMLERYDEAEQHLKRKLKINRRDFHSHLKLAEVYAASERYDDAVEEYKLVAALYAEDGFYDKGIALLSRAAKLRPLDDILQAKIRGLERAKESEQSRVIVVEGLRSGPSWKAAMELQQHWHSIADSSLLETLGNELAQRLFTQMSVAKEEPGTTLAEQGSTDGCLIFIVRGVVEATTINAAGNETSLRTFASGDLIGEGALLERQPWPATYRVSEPAVLMKLDREGLTKALTGNPDPRRFLDALRHQHHDRGVATTVRQLKTGGGQAG